MTRQTAARFKELFAVTSVAALLLGKLDVETVLPEIRRDGLELLWTILVAQFSVRAFKWSGEAPERRHFGAGTKRLRVLEPMRYPLFAQLHAHVFQVWTNLLLVLHQVLRLQV